jgi:hypothetical protein
MFMDKCKLLDKIWGGGVQLTLSRMTNTKCILCKKKLYSLGLVRLKIFA